MNSRMLWLTALALAAAEPAFPQAYFPVGALPEVAAVRYARFLTAMHEPSLFELSKQEPGAEAYRLLWLRSDRRPASIRFAPKPGGNGMVLPSHDRRHRVHSAGEPTRKRHVVVVEVPHGIFLEDHRRRGILEFGHWWFQHTGFLSFALDSGRRATGPIPCDRPLLAARKRPDSHYRSSRYEARQPESSWRSGLLGRVRTGPFFGATWRHGMHPFGRTVAIFAD